MAALPAEIIGRDRATTRRPMSLAWLPGVRRRKRFTNREGLAAVDFTLDRSSDRPGVSAALRVRNEESKIAHAIRSILPVFDQIVVVDNGSEDATAAIVEKIAEREDASDRIELWRYPHRLARCGPEHGGTPADSVHSLVYFNNWTLSRCGCRYVCKWDGDMVLRRAVRPKFRALLDETRNATRTCWTLTGQTVYRDEAGDFYLARRETNEELRIFPYGLAWRFVKHPSFERIRRPPFTRKRRFEPICFYELKYADEDEFDHWSTTEWPSERKRREWENYRRVAEGRVETNGFEKLPPDFLEGEVGTGGDG